MDFILTVISFIFVALILALALTIGFSLLLWCLAAGLLFTAAIMLRQQFQRWKFLRDNERASATEIRVIEGVYTEVTDKHK